MPRPKLELFQKKPIAYNHHSLLLSLLDCEDTDSILGRITKFPHTGLVLSESQLSAYHVRFASLPLLVEYPASNEKDVGLKRFTSWIKHIQVYSACGIVLPITLGSPQEVEERLRVKKHLAEVRKRKLLGVVRIQWSPGLQPEINLQAFAARVGIDVGADYTLMQLPPAGNMNDILLRSGGGTVIVCSTVDWLDQCDTLPIHIRRLLAGGAAGVCLSAGVSMTDEFGDVSDLIGEAIFGPGELPG